MIFPSCDIGRGHRLDEHTQTEMSSAQQQQTFMGRSPNPPVPNWAAYADTSTAEEEVSATPARAKFLEFDSSGDGKLNMNEVGEMMQSLGMRVDRLFLAGLFAQLDSDGTGYIEYGEFELMWQEMASEHRRTVKRISSIAPVSYEAKAGGAGTATTEGLQLPTMMRPGLSTPALAGRELRDACRRGDMASMRNMLDERVASVNEGDPSREYETPLHLASAEGHANVVEALLSSGASPGAQTTSGWTSLHRACLWGKTSCVASLLRGGADFRLKEVHGSTARDIAMQYGHMECVQFLDSVGAADGASGNVTAGGWMDPSKVALSGSLDRR